MAWLEVRKNKTSRASRLFCPVPTTSFSCTATCLAAQTSRTSEVVAIAVILFALVSVCGLFASAFLVSSQASENQCLPVAPYPCAAASEAELSGSGLTLSLPRRRAATLFVIFFLFSCRSVCFSKRNLKCLVS